MSYIYWYTIEPLKSRVEFLLKEEKVFSTTYNYWDFDEIINNVVRIYFDFSLGIINVEILEDLPNHYEILNRISEIFKETL